MKRIVITGATGFIGKNILNRLSPNAQILAILKDNSEKYLLPKSKNISYLISAMQNIGSIENKIKSSDIVIHLANISEGSSEDFKEINVEGTRKLVRLCEVKKIKKFIFFSSTVVLNNFSSDYSRTKKAAEDIVKKSRLNYFILRPDMVYGKDNKRHINDLIEEINLKRYYFVFGYGNIKIRPVYIEDVVSEVARAINSPEKRKIKNIISRPISYRELLLMIKRKTNSSCQLIFIPEFIALPILKLYSLLNKKSTLYNWIVGNKALVTESQFQPTGIGEGIDILIK